MAAAAEIFPARRRALFFSKPSHSSAKSARWQRPKRFGIRWLPTLLGAARGIHFRDDHGRHRNHPRASSL